MDGWNKVIDLFSPTYSMKHIKLKIFCKNIAFCTKIHIYNCFVNILTVKNKTTLMCFIIFFFIVYILKCCQNINTSIIVYIKTKFHAIKVTIEN